jgi:hypothetical protein
LAGAPVRQPILVADQRPEPELLSDEKGAAGHDQGASSERSSDSSSQKNKVILAPPATCAKVTATFLDLINKVHEVFPRNAEKTSTRAQNAPANTRNRGKRVRMLDYSDDDPPPRGAEEGSGRTVKMSKISQPGDREQRRSDEVIVISDDES